MTYYDPHARLHRRDVDYLKPKKFREYLTITELADVTGKDISWLRRLERANRIPRATRYGRSNARLWSPEQVEEIKEILATHRVGRPSKNGN
jgi:predicted DNA-binding transcriptional regulator AlpA